MGAELSDQLKKDYGYHLLEEALFHGFVVLVCSLTLLALALQKIQTAFMQFLTVSGFWLATVLIQLRLLTGNFPNQEEVIWYLNSVLVGLAFALWLCAWSAKEFRHH